ncbi:MAG TPA: N(4)-(beta-N-acetylglucosaminyl)-L-asparaginase [Blastocatellia bacterium]|nr:N(4)-(beta-N-acetylglucosaminyl)-L-asparaginase [Blastocatellia bacterium]
MFEKISRRGFFKGSVAAGIAGLAGSRFGTSASNAAADNDTLPVVIASANGQRAVERAFQMIKVDRVDTLDAVIAGVNINEDDPEDNTVGYGGLPNEDGIVELDSSVMHGPTRRAGAVAGLREVKNPSKVAYQVMKRTDHVLLVGEGALKFAVAHGFKRQDLLTEKSRIAWLAWKEAMSNKDSWGPGLATPPNELSSEERRILGFVKELGRPDLGDWVLGVIKHPPQGTINCLAVNEGGDISGVTTTSGLAWKLSGRVGDSPLVGCGLCVDNDVGAAGATGRGEEVIKTNGAHTVVEMMRRGATPQEACLEAVKRIARNYGNDRHKLAQFNVILYGVNKKGQHGAAGLWNGAWRIDQMKKSQYLVADSSGVKLLDTAYLLARDQSEMPKEK